MIRNNYLKNNYLFLGFLALLVVALYAYRLNLPAKPYFDEVHYTLFVNGLYEGKYIEAASVHPPLWHLFMAFCVKIFGNNSFSWRLVSLISGILILPVIFLLAKRITRNDLAAMLATFFFMFDCLSLTQARVAMMNAFLLLWILLSVFYFLRFIDGQEPMQGKFLIAAGVFWGLALATKLVAINLLLFFGPILLINLYQRKGGYKKTPWIYPVSLAVIPIAIFFVVHLFIPFLKDRTLADIWKILMFDLNYNATTTQTHPYMSHWWSWTIMSRPTWFFFDSQNANTTNAVFYGIVAIGNPVIFWLIPLAICYLLWDFFRNHSSASGLILLGIYSQWISYSFASRLQFFHYIYTAMPFVAMGFGLFFSRLWQKGPIGRSVVILYLILVVGMFVYWYPLLIGAPISPKFFYHHMWFPKWI